MSCMSVSKDLLQHTRLFGGKLDKLCLPIKQFFGITSVGLFYITKERSVINIHTCEEWIELCMEKKYYLHDPHIVEPHNMGVGFSVNTFFSSEEFSTGLVHDAEKYFNMHHGVSFAKRLHPDGYLALVFDTDKENSQMPNKILSNQQCITEFTLYLEQEFCQNFLSLSDISVPLIDMKNQYLELQQGIVVNEKNISGKIDLFKTFGSIESIPNAKLLALQQFCRGWKPCATRGIMIS